MAGRGGYRGRGGGIGAGRIQADGKAPDQLRPEVAAGPLQDPFTRANIVAADKNRGSMQILGTARKNRAMDQVAHLLRLDASIAENLIYSGIDGHHAVERAR